MGAVVLAAPARRLVGGAMVRLRPGARFTSPSRSSGTSDTSCGSRSWPRPRRLRTWERAREREVGACRCEATAVPLRARGIRIPWMLGSASAVGCVSLFDWGNAIGNLPQSSNDSVLRAARICPKAFPFGRWAARDDLGLRCLALAYRRHRHSREGIGSHGQIHVSSFPPGGRAVA